MYRWIMAIFFWGLMNTLPAPASACDYNCVSDGQAAGIFSGVAIGLGFVVSDGILMGYDISSAAARKHPSRGWAIAEVTVSSTQLAASLVAPFVFRALGFGGGSLSFGEAYGGVYAVFGLPFTLAAAPLLIHGIWALRTERKAAESPRLAALLPAPVFSSQGANRTIGLAWSGRF